MDDSVKQDKLLRSATQWQRKPALQCVTAGDEAASFLQRRKRQFDKNAALVDAWEALVPPGLKSWCRLDSCSAQTLTVQAMPGPYMHQLQIMQHELLAELHRRCPSAGIRKLRIIPLKENSEDMNDNSVTQ